MAYAGFWLRLVAYIIDAIILGMAGVIAFFPLFRANIHAFTTENPWEVYTSMSRPLFAIRLLALMLGWIYYASMESSSWQATLGQENSGSEGDGSGREPNYFCARFGPLLRKDSLRHDSGDWFSDGGLHGTKAGVARYSCGLSGAAAALVFFEAPRRNEDTSVLLKMRCAIDGRNGILQRLW